MKHLSLAVLLALGLSVSHVVSAKLVPDYQSSNFVLSTQDGPLINLRHRYLHKLCSMYDKVHLGPVAAYLNKNLNFDHSSVAILDKALITFKDHLEQVPGLQKPKEEDDDTAKNEEETKKPHPKTKAERRAAGIEQRNNDLVEQYRDPLLALAKKGDNLNMPEAQKRVNLNLLQYKVDQYLSKRYAEDFQYEYFQDIYQDLLPYLDMNNPFPCLYVQDVKDAKAAKASAPNGKAAK